MVTKEEVKHQVEALSIDNVKNVYSGKAHKCCCGCSGIHRYNSRFVSDEYEESNINDRYVKKVIAKIKAELDHPHAEYDLGGEYVALSLYDKQFIAYLV